MSAIWSEISVGEERSFEVGPLSRSHFVRYAGASGDFNPIHFDETVARAAGLPEVFGQGMFTAGVLSRILSEWFGPASVRRYAVRFVSRVWPGDHLRCRGTVRSVQPERGPTVELELEACNQDGTVLVRGEATVCPWKGGA